MDYLFKMSLPKITQEINTIKEEVTTIKANYFPKSGGLLTGKCEIRTSGNDESFVLKNLNDDSAVVPTTRQARAFRTYDKNGKILGDIRFGHETTGEINTAIIARYTNAEGTASNATLQLSPNSGGTAGSMYLKFNGQHVVRVVATYKNGLSWYRKYSDGWIEQGGRNTPSDYAGSLVTLPIAFKDANYTAVAQSADKTNKRRCQIYQNSATQIWIRTMTTGDGQSQTPVNWYCCGY